MLTLYCSRDCPACDELERQLREHRLAHKLVRVDAVGSSDAGLPAGTELPLLRDGSESFVGGPAIGEHLERVARVKDRWQKHGADACYCDEEGEVL